MSRPLPTLRIGSFAAMSLDIEHVRVFAEDAEAFRGVIAARAALVERQITRFVPPHRAGQGLCEEALNLTLDALLELRNAGADRGGSEAGMARLNAARDAGLKAAISGRSQ